MNAPLLVPSNRGAEDYRVSSNERLDLPCISNDVQKEGGRACIRSQKHAGTTPVADY